jgi:hypothetical protein
MLSFCSSIIFGAVADTGNSEDFLPMDSSNTTYDSSVPGKIIKGGTACPTVYSPVCVEVVVQCIKAPCNPDRQTFSNSCMAGKNKILFHGTCENSDYQLNISTDDYDDLLKLSYFEISPLDDGGVSLNLAFLNNLKTDFKVTYFNQNKDIGTNSFTFYSRNSVGLEIHPNYTIPNSDSKLNLESDNIYTVKVTDLNENEVYMFTEFRAGQIVQVFNQTPLIHTDSNTGFSAKDGKFGQTCEDWLTEKGIEFSFLSTRINENILSGDFQQRYKNLNCIYKHGDNVIIEHYKTSPNPNSYPVTAAVIRDSNGEVTDQYFTKIGFNSQYYNSLSWDSLDNVPDGKWGQSCYEWLEEKGFNNYEVRAYDKYGVLSPTICAYNIYDASGDVYCTYAGAAGNFAKLNFPNQRIKPVAFCDTSVLRISSQVAKLEKNVSTVKPEPTISKCTFLDINLIDTIANDAKFFEIVSENCVGEYIDIEVYEDDALVDDLVEVISIRFSSDNQRDRWVFKNSDDGLFGGEPEFYFKFKFSKSMIFSKN